MFGYRLNPLTGVFMETFDEMRQWKTFSQTIDGHMDITDPKIPDDPYPAAVKQVYCERKNYASSLSYCAADGGNCTCPVGGIVMRGLDYEFGNKEKIFGGNFTMNTVN